MGVRINKLSKLKGTFSGTSTDPLLTNNASTGAVDTAINGLGTLASGKIWVGSAGNLPVAQTITGDISINNSGVAAISAGVVVDADINAAAAITLSKLAALTASRAVITDGSGVLTISPTTSTQLGYLSTTTSDVQTQLNGKQATLTGATTSVTTANLTPNIVVVSDGGGKIASSSVSTTALGFISTLSSNAQTQLNTKLTVSLGSVVTGDILYYNGTAWTNLARGTSGQTLQSTGSSIQWGTPTINGIPIGGATGQYLAKNSGTDYDAGWTTLTLSKVTDVTALAADLNLLAGANAFGITSANIQTLQGVSSNIQGQLNTKLSNSLPQNYLFLGNALNQAGQLAPGTNGYVLTTVSGVPTWQALPAASTPGHVIQNSGAGLTQRSNLNFTSGLSAVDNSGANSSDAKVDLTYNFVWTGTHSWTDNNFSIKDNLDTTKILNFQLASISTGTTRTYTWPDVTATVATIDGGQTFTSATWNGSVIGSNYGGAGSVNGILKANGSGVVSAAVPGTDYVVGGTAWLLASGGTLTGANTITGTTSNTLKYVFNSLGTTQTDGAGAWYQNSTAATLGNQQLSPLTTWEGQGFGTGANTSQSVKYAIDVLPVQRATNPSGTWRLRQSVNGAAYSDVLTYDNFSGIFTFTGAQLAVTSSILSFANGGIERGRFISGDFLVGSQTDNARLYVLQAALSSSWLPAFRLDPGAHTNITASAEQLGSFVNINAATQQWATGTLATQRFNYFGAPTVAFVGASTATNVYNVYIEAPIAGTNATFTNNWALGLNGNLNLASASPSQIQFTTSGGSIFFVGGGTIATTSSGVLNINTNNGANLNSSHGQLNLTQGTPLTVGASAIVSTPAALTNLTLSTEFISRDFKGATQQWATGALTTQRWNYFRGYTAAFVGASTLSDAFTVYIDPPVAGTNATISRIWALGVNGNSAFGNPNGTAFMAWRSPGSSSGPLWRIQNSTPNTLLFMQEDGSVSFTQVAQSSSFITGFKINPGASTSITASTELLGSFLNIAATTQQWATGSLTTQRFNYFGIPTVAFVGASTATDVYNAYFEGPVAGTNATITNPYAIGGKGGIKFLDLAGTKNLLIIPNSGAQIVSSASGVQIQANNGNVGGISLNGSTPTGNTMFVSAGFALQNPGGVASGQNIISINPGSSLTWTTGSGVGVIVSSSFIPTSGTGAYATFSIAPSINQTGGANGAVTYLDINPTRTSVVGSEYGILVRPSAALNGFGTATPSANIHLVQAGQSAVWTPAFRVDAGAHTGMTAGTEFFSTNFTFNTQQWATGTVNQQRWVYFGSPTPSFVGASTLSNAFTLYVDPPTAGTNATITNNFAFGTGGDAKINGRLLLVQPSLSSGWNPAITSTPGTHTSFTASTEFISRDFQGVTQAWIDGTTTTQRFNYFKGFTLNKTTTSATFTNAYTVYIDPSSAGTGVTITNNFALGLNGNLGLIAAPSNDDALTQILARDSTTGIVKYRNSSTLAGLSGLLSDTVPVATSTTTLGNSSITKSTPDYYYVNGNTNGTAAFAAVNASTGSVALGMLACQAGTSVGQIITYGQNYTGRAGDVEIINGSSSPQNTVFTRGNSNNSMLIGGGLTTLTESTATSVLRIKVPTSKTAGGELIVSIEAGDGTDFQHRTIRVVFAAVNKGGTITVANGTTEEVVAVSTGTLTATLTYVDSGSGNLDIKVNAVSSLTQTFLRAQCFIVKNMGDLLSTF